MEAAGEGKLLLTTSSSFSILRNPLLRSLSLVHEQCERAERTTKSWLAAQPLIIETAVSGASGSVQGALVAGAVLCLAGDDFDFDFNFDFGKFLSFGHRKRENKVSFSTPFVQARNFAVMAGTNASISTAMKRIRGKEDLQSRMIAGFGSGAVFSIVSGVGSESRSKQTAFAVSSGLLFAFIQAGIFKLGQAVSPGKNVIQNFG